jgi:hypothetical protein
MLVGSLWNRIQAEVGELAVLGTPSARIPASASSIESRPPEEHEIRRQPGFPRGTALSASRYDASASLTPPIASE